MARQLRAVLVLFSVVVAGCAAPRIDGSSDDAFKKTLARVRDSLNEERRVKFDEAIMGVALKDLNFMQAAALGPDSISAGARTALDKKTGEDVIAEFEKIKAERVEKERQAALAEMAELVKERAASAAARAELDKVTVERARFSVDRSGFMAEPVIQLRVRNGTSHPIARAFFRGRIVSVGRSVPWLEEDFNYTIPGGLESGEVGEWRLSPNSFSPWGTVRAPADAGLEVTVLRVDGAAGQLFSVQEFTAQDEARLAALEKEHAPIKK